MWLAGSSLPRFTHYPRRPRFALPPASVSKRHRAGCCCRRIRQGGDNHRAPASPQHPLPSPHVPLGVGRSVGVRAPGAPLLASYLPPPPVQPPPATWLNGTPTPRHTESESHHAI